MKRSGVLALIALLSVLGACKKPASDAAASDAASVTADAASGASAAAPRTIKPCPEAERYLADTDCDIVKDTLGRVRVGESAFNWPKAMHRGETRLLRFAVGDAPPPIPARATAGTIDTQADIPSSAAGADADSAAASTAPARTTPPEVVSSPAAAVKDLPGETVEYKSIIGRFMSARLNGEGFEIKALSPESQEVPPDSVTAWDWQVKASEAGKRTLVMTTVVEAVLEDGKRIPLKRTEQSRLVEVNVAFPDNVMDFLVGLPAWLKALTGVLTAVAAALAAWFGLIKTWKKQGT